jgi:hypothetical protein
MIASHGNRWFRLIVPGLLVSLSLNAQQPAAPPAADTTKVEGDIAALKAQLVEQQRQLEQLRAAMQKQQDLIEKATKQVEDAEAARATPPASLGQVASTTPVLPMPAVAVPNINPAVPLSAAQKEAEENKPSPLGIRLGNATFTPLGFIDFITITRSTDVGSSIGTSFSGIPFQNTLAGELSETHFSMQNSRLGMKVDSEWKGIKVLGYWESDFLGNNATNPFVTSNADTFRLRLFFVDLQKDAFELTAGQTWSLATPNRTGIGVLPSTVFYSQDIDTNYQLGLTWARQTGMRFTWHPSEHVHWAIAAENPEQYIGGAVVAPSKLATVASTEFDNGSGGTAIPNFAPDIISKLAFDGGAPGHAAHLEFTGILSTFRSYNSLTSGPGAGNHYFQEGGGGEVNFNIELLKGFRVISSNSFGDGMGRYIANSGAPDVIMRANGSISLVHSYSTVSGLEFQATPKTMFYAYYGGAYVAKNLAIDQDNKTIIGYGVNNNLSANRAIQEATFGVINNFWKSPEYGSLMLAFQYSYVFRNPWSVTTAGAPNSTNTNMGFVDFRYTLP